MDRLTYLFLFLLSCVNANDPNSPIIGMFAHPFPNSTQQYIAASYVKWVESGGGRVVPISYYATPSECDELFAETNGLFFPGGEVNHSDAAAYMYNKAVTANSNGDHYPIWGTCLGFQWLVELAGGMLQDGFISINMSLPMKISNTSSRLLHARPDLSTLAVENITFNYHHQGITPHAFASTPHLVGEMTVIATSVDGVGTEFVAAMEAKNQPFYGVQFHPEKALFEHGENADGTPMEAIAHTSQAVRFSSELAGFFVDEARKSTSHAFSSPAKEEKALIYNYPVTQTLPGSHFEHFMQIYLFDF